MFGPNGPSSPSPADGGWTTAGRRLSARDGRTVRHAGLSLLVLVAAGFLAHRHWPVIESGAGMLGHADRGWLLVAAVATLATWVCSALAQQGAVAEPLPAGRLVAVQFAAASANHVLPSGLGAGAVNLRFLTRCGLPFARSATALAVKACAGTVVRGCLIGGLALACPGALRLPRLTASAWTVAAWTAGVVVAAVAAALFAGPLRRALRRVLLDVRAVHEVPARAAALWGGSLAFAALHATVVIAVAQAIGLSLSPARVALVYLAASSAAVLLPTPGGLGSLDAALALALTFAGAPGEAAASTVLGYRLLTVWLPLLPGLVALGVLIRRRVL
ncbi:lysylphosphatidylglycerol synthase transmembrane domain-containing protein [Streptomyces sp. NBC_00151]|uniref:lysylphosphatidylglycerol synthase transmembrane domain-containing protein n=1 Tax=Streptomyces sp. NBC_00151 TaxID=2975669 RepID=UPI003FA3BCFA